jgi:5-methylcytosine-specific restriction protein A
VHIRVSGYVHDPRAKKLYNSARWKRLRDEQLKHEPYCADCLKEGRQVLGNQVHHVVPHEGDAEKFYSGKLQTLCDRHHTMKKRDEQRISQGEGA